MQRMGRVWWLATLVVMMGLACNAPTLKEAGITTPEGTTLPPTVPATHTLAPSETPTHTPTPTRTPTPSQTPTSTSTPTASLTPTETPTPTVTPTPTITPSPTFTFPTVTVLMQANCRYGPGTAYLYAHGMYTGDTGVVWGRNSSGTWLWIQPFNIEYQCWISTSVVEVQGDIFSVTVAPVRLPHSTLYSSPETVNAVRNDDTVTVTWSGVPMTEDDFRGYMIEATVCQDGNLVWLAVATNGTSYDFTDETTCDGDSSGLLYAVEKHGYTDPVVIPWP
jgi:hypothetical protein